LDWAVHLLAVLPRHEAARRLTARTASTPRKGAALYNMEQNIIAEEIQKMKYEPLMPVKKSSLSGA